MPTHTDELSKQSTRTRLHAKPHTKHQGCLLSYHPALLQALLVTKGQRTAQALCERDERSEMHPGGGTRRERMWNRHEAARVDTRQGLTVSALSDF